MRTQECDVTVRYATVSNRSACGLRAMSGARKRTFDVIAAITE